MKSIKYSEELFELLRRNVTSSLSESLNEFNKGEVGVLSYLTFDVEKSSAGELSEKLNVTTARIASILNSLETKQLVKRQVDDCDKRKTIVVITEKGRETVLKTKEDIMKKINILIEKIGYEELKEYSRIADKIRNVLTKQ